MPQIKVENLYKTSISSPANIADSGDIAINVLTPPSNPQGFIVISPESVIRQEICYYHDVIGNTIYIRGVNRLSPKPHVSGEIVQISDVAQIFNTFSDMISQAFYVEKTGGLNIKVWGGYFIYNNVQQYLPDTIFSLVDNTINYIKYDPVTNQLISNTSNSGNIKVAITTLSGSITDIDYRVSKEAYASGAPGNSDMFRTTYDPAGILQQLVGTTAIQNISNKTLISPIINLGSDDTGDIYYRNSSGRLTRLPIGTTGQILNVNSGIPAWTNPVSNQEWTLIETLTPSNVTTFSSSTFTAYDKIRVEYSLTASATSTAIGVQINTITSGYGCRYFSGAGVFTAIGITNWQITNFANTYQIGELFISGKGTQKIVYANTGGDGSGQNLISGHLFSSSDITSLTFIRYFGSGTFTGTVKIYGKNF